jgi:hypothetical protein
MQVQKIQMITKTPIVAIVGMNTLSWTASLDERVTRVDTAAESSNQPASEFGRMDSGELKTTPTAAFLTMTGKPSTW